MHCCDFDGGSLESNQTEVYCTGSEDAVVVANSSLHAKVFGSGDVEYKGAPSEKDVRIFGSGDVNKHTGDM